MKEIWKDIIGYNGVYQVSNLGRVKSIARKIPVFNHPGFKSKKIIERIRKCVKRKNGYIQVPLHKLGAQKYFYVHRLVYESHVGKIKSGMDINHKDFDRSNNNVNNLECVTRIQNIHYSCKKGRYPRKITNEQREEIKSSKEKPGILAKKYGVHRSHIWLIRGSYK